MGVGSTMKTVGRSARYRAESMTHDMKDRALEKRLEQAHSETERLRTENEVLRDEVSDTRAEHKRILDMLEDRLAQSPEVVEVEPKRKSKKGRRLLFLSAIAGGVWYWIKQRGGESRDEWSRGGDTPVTQTGTTTTL
jgi:hypothetical protein